MKIFISSTYSDLKDYRKKVIDQLERIRRSRTIKMEYFPISGKDPTTLSLEELRRCNVYIGIIGHRYGSASPDSNKSITQCEYYEAYDLYRKGEMELLLYLAEDEVQPTLKLRESDDLFSKQQEFRKKLTDIHVVRFFRSPDHLAALIAIDLFNLERDIAQNESKIFSFNSWPDIRKQFDRSSDQPIVKIEKEILEFLVANFETLFYIDPEKPDVHPFFRKAREKLGNVIPGISLNEEDGILKRTGVRHVIMRTQTAKLLIKNLPKDKLFEVGVQIGTSAAYDLIENTIKAKMLIPASAEAFVVLWDYWDRTGGWGKLTFVGPDSDTSSVPKPEWHIKVENNFLTGKEIDETHRLSSFWCGYIQGILNEALPKIEEIMIELDDEERKKVTLPAYHRVADVTHKSGDNSEDIFYIKFSKMPYSDARQQLTKCQIKMKSGEFGIAMDLCRLALLAAQQELGEIKFKEMLSEMKQKDTAIISKILKNQGNGNPEEKVNEWFIATNSLVQQLSSPELNPYDSSKHS